MKKVRIIIKHTCQPPIDTPAVITWSTVDVESEALLLALLGDNYTTSAAVGAEILPDSSEVASKGE